MTDEALLSQYRQDGYLVIESLFPPDMIKVLQSATQPHVDAVTIYPFEVALLE